MKTKFPYGIRLALLASEKSTSKVQVGAALIVKKNLIVAACNSDKSSPGAAKWFRFYENGIHAEYNLFNRVLLSELPIRGIVYIARRLPSTGETGLARPCSSCRAMLRDLGIKKVVFSDYGNTYKKEKL